MISTSCRTIIFSLQCQRYVTIPSRSRKKGQVGLGQAAVRKPGRQIVVNTEPVNSLLNPLPIQNAVKNGYQRSTNGQHSSTRGPANSNAEQASKQTLYQAIKLNTLGVSGSVSPPLPLGHDKKTVLDKLFRDRGPNNLVSRKSHLIGLKGRPYVLPSPVIPVASHPEEVHGVPSFLVQHAYTLRFLQNTPVAYSCSYFTAYYLPPWHFLALGRKSRPALLSTFSQGAEYNGNPEFAKLLSSSGGNSNTHRRSRNPMSYAFSRKGITQRTRNALWTAFTSIPDSVDGLYLFRSHNYPNDLEDLQLHINELVKRASTIGRGDSSWAEDFNKKIKWSSMDHMCKKRLIPPLVRFQAGRGLDWRSES